GVDTMAFNGSAVAEKIDVSANGSRVRLTRDIASITMDLDDVERIAVKALGGVDTVTVNDLSGTDVTNVIADLSVNGNDDGSADNVVVNGTQAADVVTVAGAGSNMQVAGLSALVNVAGGFAPNDRLTINTLAGDDVIDASGVAAGATPLTLAGGDGDDVLIG